MSRLNGKIALHRDLLLLLTLLLIYIIYPLLDHGTARTLTLSALIGLVMVVATLSVSQKRGLLWTPVLLLCVAGCFAAAAMITSKPVFTALKWATVMLFVALIISGLFVYLRDAHEITHAHLYTAATIYLLLALLWFALYNCIEVLYPGSFRQGTTTLDDPRAELLYFSLVTLTTVGYGDIVPTGRVVRMLAALEAGAGVLYVAITVAVLVSAHKRREFMPVTEPEVEQGVIPLERASGARNAAPLQIPKSETRKPESMTKPE